MVSRESLPILVGHKNETRRILWFDAYRVKAGDCPVPHAKMKLSLRRVRVMSSARHAGLIACGYIAMALAANAQSAAQKATTVSALVTYPLFYHAQRVVVQRPLVQEGRLTWLASGEARVLCLGCPSETDGLTRYEAAGIFWDVGRLEPGDSRLGSLDLGPISERLLQKPWPASGEMPALVTDQVRFADQPDTPSIRMIALDPERYESEDITLVGRFRGRNLYGDLPNAPRQSRWDFVLQSADGSIWVTGIEPRGDDFFLSPNARVDTNRWIEVSGTVRGGQGLVWLEATQIALAKPLEEPVGAVSPRPPEPSPEVIFSAPTAEDTDVQLDTSVRLQFSRDMDADSFEECVRASYLQAPAAAGEIGFTIAYDEGKRVLEITFPEPLERFRTVKIELLDAITARDGAAMGKPWVLTFTLGGN